MGRSLKVTGWNLLLVLAALLVAEAVFGSWFRAPALWHLSIYRDKDWRLATDDKYPRTDPVHYRRDYYGLRGAYGSPSDVDILVLGGSTTDERFVSEGETWPDVMGACLSQDAPTVNVANAGVTGQTTRGHAANFDLWLNHIPDLAPRYVLAFFGVNEFFIDGLDDKDDVRRFTEATYAASRIKVFRKWLQMNSALYAAYQVVRGMVRGDRPEFAKVHPAERRGETGVHEVERRIVEAGDSGLVLGSPDHMARVAAYGEREATHLKAYRDRLAVLRGKILAFKAEPIFVVQAWGNYRIGEGGRVLGDAQRLVAVDAYDRTVMAFCAETKTRCIDLAAAIRHRAGDFWDAVHTTPQGSARIGREICRQLKAMDGFQPAKAEG